MEPRRASFDAFNVAWTHLWRTPVLWGVSGLITAMLAQMATLPMAIPLQIYLQFQIQGHHNNPFYVYTLPTTWILLAAQLALGGFAYPLYTGLTRTALRTLRGEELSPGMLFELNGMYWRSVGLFFIMAFAYLIGVCFFIIPGLIVLKVGMVAQLVLVERKCTIREAIEISARAVWPSIWTILGVEIVAALASMLGIIACCLGIYVTMPIYYIATAEIYRQLFDPLPSETSFLAPRQEV